MTTPEVELRTAWQRLAGAGRSEPFDALLARLREPHRQYHTAAHVMWVLRHAEHILDGLPGQPLDADAVRLAALWHDAVYDPTASDNEDVSARLAHGVALHLGWTGARASLVEELVASTAPGWQRPTPQHAAAAIDEFDVLHDADLAILGSEPAAYQAYVNGVRREFAHVTDDAWRLGRSSVIRSILAADPLYRTPAMMGRTARARANLTAELAALEP